MDTYTWQEVAYAATTSDMWAFLFLCLMLGVAGLALLILFIQEARACRPLAAVTIVGVLFLAISGICGYVSRDLYTASRYPCIAPEVPVAQLPESLKTITPVFVELDTTSPFYRIEKKWGRKAPIKLTIYCSKQYIKDTAQPVYLDSQE